MARHIRVTVGSFDPPAAPATTLDGWDLTPANVGLAGVGLVGASLPAYSGPATIPSGTTITEQRFTYPVNVSAGDITIERCFFQPTTILGEAICQGTYPQGDITIGDCEIDGSLIPAAVREGAYGFQGGANLYRNYVHDVGIGIAMMSSTNTRDFGEIPLNIVIENNYVHELFHYSDGHHEAGTVRDFVKNAANTRTMVWRGNYLDTDSPWASAGLFLQPTAEDYHNVWLENNVFAGNGWNLSLSDNSGLGLAYSNFHATNNRFREGLIEWYGPTALEGGPGWTTWENNRMYDANQPDAAGTLVAEPIP